MCLIRIFFFSLVILKLNLVCASSRHGTFTAAVLEHKVVLPPNRRNTTTRPEALKHMNVNLDVYARKAREAHLQNADIIVFPEDGIYGVGHSWEGLTAYLEYIPDPKKTHWIPCDDPARFPNSEVQATLSCMAKKNSMYIVANMGDKQTCDKTIDPNCPSSGHYQYNTDVVYNPKGLLIARYHKQNLFFEYQFSTPAENPTYFDTPFGRFGVFTCFDIIFYSPTMKLINDLNIRNIAFPTAWMDVPPHLAAVEFHSAVAAGLRLNFLAANIHWPEKRFQGSGIYSPTGAKSYYYNNSIDSDGKLLVSSLDILGDDVHIPKVSKPLQHQASMTKDNVFSSLVFGDPFNFIELKDSSGMVQVCHNSLCCQLDYSADKDSLSRDLYAFGAFSDLHTKEGSYFIEVCILLKCASNNISMCGEPTKEASTVFSSFQMKGNMSTAFVYPEILLMGDDFMYKLSTRGWSYANKELTCNNCSMGHPLIASSLFGRNFARDPKLASLNKAHRIMVSKYVFLTSCIMILSFKPLF